MSDFEYPAPRYPAYLKQERVDDIEMLMPIARSVVRHRYGRAALGDLQQDDQLLIVTYPNQNQIVLEALKRALLEDGAKKVDSINLKDLGIEGREFSAADGWREITDRLAAMTERGVEYKVEAEALKRYLDDRPGYTGVFTGESGRNHWKRVTGGKIRNNWCFNTYEDFISRGNNYPDELWRMFDLKILEYFKRAEAVRITDPQGTDISWRVTEQQAALWPNGAYIAGHILGSTLQGIRFAHPAETFLEQAKILMPTVNGVIAGTSNHTGYFPHIKVEVEGGMIKQITGGGKYGDLWREVVERYREVEYPGFPYKGWAYFNDASIGTNPWFYRHVEGLWGSGDPATNLPERMRAGVVHFGFGAEHWDKEFLSYAKSNNLPTMHFPHVHNIFPTYEILERGTGRWVKVIDKGRLTLFDDPEVVRLASSIGGKQLLEYHWIPAVPGVNYEGDYNRDYAEDPISWIERDQDGEFGEPIN